MYFLGLKLQGFSPSQILERYRQDFPELFPEESGTGDVEKQQDYDNRRENEIDLIRKAITRIDERLGEASRRLYRTK